MPTANRMNISVTDKLRERLKSLSLDTGLSFSEIIRRAVALYSVAWKINNDGNSLSVTGPNGELIETLDVFSISKVNSQELASQSN